MEKYTKVSERITPEEKIKENEIRITSSGKMRNYIDYAEKNLTNAVIFFFLRKNIFIYLNRKNQIRKLF